jgi:hypothetical protein
MTHKRGTIVTGCTGRITNRFSRQLFGNLRTICFALVA